MKKTLFWVLIVLLILTMVSLAGKSSDRERTIRTASQKNPKSLTAQKGSQNVLVLDKLLPSKGAELKASSFIDAKSHFLAEIELLSQRCVSNQGDAVVTNAAYQEYLTEYVLLAARVFPELKRKVNSLMQLQILRTKANNTNALLRKKQLFYEITLAINQRLQEVDLNFTINKNEVGEGVFELNCLLIELSTDAEEFDLKTFSSLVQARNGSELPKVPVRFIKSSKLLSHGITVPGRETYDQVIMGTHVPLAKGSAGMIVLNRKALRTNAKELSKQIRRPLSEETITKETIVNEAGHALFQLIYPHKQWGGIAVGFEIDGRSSHASYNQISEAFSDLCSLLFSDDFANSVFLILNSEHSGYQFSRTLLEISVEQMFENNPSYLSCFPDNSWNYDNPDSPDLWILERKLREDPEASAQLKVLAKVIFMQTITGAFQQANRTLSK